MMNEEKDNLASYLLKETLEIPLKIDELDLRMNLLLLKATETDNPIELIVILEELKKVKEETMELEKRMTLYEISAKRLEEEGA